MILSDEERRLYSLYYAGSTIDTAHILRCALKDIYDPDERTTTVDLIWKLENRDESEFEAPAPESVVSYE